MEIIANNQKRKDKRNLFFKIIKNGRTVDKCQTHSLRRFRNKIRTINWKDLKKNGGEVYLKVNYGKHLDNFGKRTTFINDGVYEDKESFFLALNAFLED